MHERMRSPMPAAESNVEARTGKKPRAKRRISWWPLRRMAARTFMPSSMPRQKPHESVMQFLSAPHRSTPIRSGTSSTAKLGVEKSFSSSSAASWLLVAKPSVASAYSSLAISR